MVSEIKLIKNLRILKRLTILIINRYEFIFIALMTLKNIFTFFVNSKFETLQLCEHWERKVRRFLMPFDSNE